MINDQSGEILSWDKKRKYVFGPVPSRRLGRSLGIDLVPFADDLEVAVLGVNGQGIKTTLVADVHTHAVEQRVVEEGVGYVALIIVACPRPYAPPYLAAGPVLSHYEFKHPMSDRLTDEAWRQLLDSSQRPPRAAWYEPLIGQ
jgi:hypothetical protein